MTEWQGVTSSSIERVGYDGDRMTMLVEFRNGSIYEYFDVPEHVYGELKGAGSPGQYLAQHVKSRYRYARA
jgi:hypothetical protein